MLRRSSVVVYDIDDDEEARGKENEKLNRRVAKDYSVFAQNLPKVHITQYEDDDNSNGVHTEEDEDEDEEDAAEVESYGLKDYGNENDEEDEVDYDYKGKRNYDDDIGNEIADDEMGGFDEDIDDDDDDDDLLMDELLETKIIPRTLPNTEVLIYVNNAFEGKKFNDMNTNELKQYKLRNESHVSTFFKKSPFNQTSSNQSILSTNSNLNDKDRSLNIPRRQKPKFKVKKENSMNSGDNESFLKPQSRLKGNSYSYDTASEKTNLQDSVGDSVKRFVTSPFVNTQDKLLLDIDKLNDVRNQIKHISMYDPFPSEFENNFKKLKQNHKKVRQLLREREMKRREGQRKKTMMTNNELLSVHSQISDKKREKSPSISTRDMTHSVRTTAPSHVAMPSIYERMDHLRESQIDSVMNDTEDSQVIQQLVNIIREL